MNRKIPHSHISVCRCRINYHAQTLCSDTSFERFNWDMGCSRILLENCDETFSKRRHNRTNDTEVSWKAVTTVTFFRFFESSDKRHSYIKRAGQIFRLRYTFTHKKGSEIWIHSKALLWEFSFIKDLANCRYEEISTAVSVEAVRSDTLFS